ncbi:MAG TPA: DNA repair protein RadA [Phycisphaerales bacterium]|nr:DNA repair protein RadA [Phycisphaerales bacterium]
MAKVRQVFECRSCGGAQSRWAGKCPDCGAWDTLALRRLDASAARDPQQGLAEGWSRPTEGSHAAAQDDATVMPGPTAAPIALATAGPPAPRLRTGIGELDRVLGGGLVPGSVVLVGGDPGIGKSTLMLQAAGHLAGQQPADPGSGPDPVRVLYVSSEESAEQVRLRAARLGTGTAAELFVLADTNLARIIEQARQVRPAVLVLDSVQMVYKADLDAPPGSLTQLRRCCAELVYLAKLSGIAVVLVGHVTKDGRLAGPRLLEHLVDTVLFFEGDRHHAHRILRAVKNRFGTTLEIGIFQMTGAGLRELPEGAGVCALPAAEAAPRPGSVVCPVLTGTRCVMVEVQALTATGFLGAAKRKSSGLDPSRLAMIIAVLEQHAGLRLADRDVFASSVGGIRVVEPAADLALLLAIAGAFHKRSLAPATAVVGEVGLGGEVRQVTQAGQRVAEAARLGFARLIIPAPGGSRAAGPDHAPPAPRGVQAVAVRTIDQAIAELG